MTGSEPPSDAFHDPRITAMGLLSEVHTGILDRLTPLLAQHKLSLAEFDVLIRLARSPGQRLRMSDLAAQTVLSTSGVTRVVDRLERSGLVTRQSCLIDRRGYFAELTAEGVSRLSAMLPLHNELVERWYTGLLGAEQLAQFQAMLRTIRDAVRPGSTAGADASIEARCLERPPQQ
jgi:MarR family transcriptional regulator, 2-MHQ and catechol-resistance regulon repressor